MLCISDLRKCLCNIYINMLLCINIIINFLNKIRIVCNIY